MTTTEHAAAVSGGTRPNREHPVAGVLVPDSKMALAATEFVRDTAGDLIFHHSRRVYFFGSLQGRHSGLSFNPELLYIGAMFHDLGLRRDSAAADADSRWTAPMKRAASCRATRSRRTPSSRLVRDSAAHDAGNTGALGSRGRAGRRGRQVRRPWSRLLRHRDSHTVGDHRAAPAFRLQARNSASVREWHGDKA